MRKLIMLSLAASLGVLLLTGCADNPDRFSDRICHVVTSGNLERYPELLPPGIAKKMRDKMTDVGKGKLQSAGMAALYNSFYACEAQEYEIKECADTAIGGLTPERKQEWGIESLDQCATLRLKLNDRMRDNKGKMVAGAEHETTIIILKSGGRWYMDPVFLGEAF